MWIHTASLNLRRIGAVIVVLSCLGMSACGSSEDNQGGSTETTEPPKALTANTAGKACTDDGDCGTGSCEKQLNAAGGGLLGPSTVPAPGGYCSFNCKLNADCGAGGVCIGANATGGFGFGNTGGANQAASGQCLKRCDSSSQCRDGYRCLDSNNGRAMESGNAEPATNATGSCQVAPETDTLEPGVVGKECMGEADCGGGWCMANSQLTQFPGGYCTGNCLANSDCGEGAECSQGFGGPGTCYRTCEADGDCGREGYRCRGNTFAPNSAKRCVPGMEPLADGIVGSECTADDDCGGAAMSCITMNGDRVLPGGYCSGGCVEDVDCGAGAFCVGSVGSIGGAGTGFCYLGCESVSDCREGYVCEAVGFAAMGGTGRTACTLPAPAPADDADAGTP